MKGKILVVGVGPGDPMLLTIKGKETIKSSKILCIPRTKNGSLAYEICRDFLDKDSQIIWVDIEMGGGGEGKKRAIETMANMIEAGRSLTYVALGDPALYSTFWGVWDSLKVELPNLDEKVQLEIVPGVSSVTACAAAAKVPLASGDESILITTRSSSKNPDTLVILKCTDCANVWDELKSAGMEGIAVRRATMEDEKIGRIDGDYMTTVIARRRWHDGRKR